MQGTLIFECRSLNAAKRDSLLMAGAGVVAGLLANSDALLPDGLFSGLNFATAMAAICLALLPQPIKVFLVALPDIVGVALPADARAEIIGQALLIRADSPFQALDVATVRSGGRCSTLSIWNPPNP